MSVRETVAPAEPAPSSKPLDPPHRSPRIKRVRERNPRTPGPALAGRRNPRWVALGVIAICLGGLLSYVIYARVASVVSVVQVAHTVHRGAVIKAEDLTTLTVRGGSVPAAIPAGELPRLVGQRAQLDLAEGSIIPRSAIGGAVVPAPGQSLIGLKLANGRLPSTLLVSGSPVRLVALPATDTQGPPDKLAGAQFAGVVVQLSPAADGASALLDVTVSRAHSAAVAQLAAQDRIAVIRDPEA